MEYIIPCTITGKKYPIDEIKIVSTEHVVEEARIAIAGGAEMIIARGLQASLIKKYTNVPVIEIVMTAQEMALLIIKAKQIVQKESPVIGIVGFKNMFCDMSYFDTIYNIELRTYFSADGDELREVCVCHKTRNRGPHRNYMNMMDYESCHKLIEAVYEPHFLHYKEDFGKTIAGFFRMSRN